MNPQEPSPTTLRFFQFGLRQLLLLFALVSLLLGILAPRLHRVYQERQFVKAWRELQEAQATLYRAVRGNDVTLARVALEAGADPNVFPDTVGPLLHGAIENGHIAMMELLHFGADVEHVARLQPHNIVAHGPPFYAAVGCNQPAEVRIAMIRLLVERGADPCREVQSRNAMDTAVCHSDARVGDVLREYGLAYGPREMAAFDRLDEVPRVVKETSGVLKERYRPTYAARPGQAPTLLGIALESGYREMAMFLIESGARLDTVEYLGQTPLHHAVRDNRVELVRLLLAAGADPTVPDRDGATADRCSQAT